jgi:hypothetical protein
MCEQKEPAEGGTWRRPVEMVIADTSGKFVHDIEPGSPAWQARIIPLNQCVPADCDDMSEIMDYMGYYYIPHNTQKLYLAPTPPSHAPSTRSTLAEFTFDVRLRSVEL